MSGSTTRRRPLRFTLAGLGLIAAIGLSGCQVDIGGQTLPSPYYLQDDVQYFPPGPEFKLAREAAALKAAREEAALQQMEQP
ncbi:MAG: hypothetical protein HUU20_10390 [Pirellulales bacterium]|nr:hypothetical protein [Pirellulales bacterium]